MTDFDEVSRAFGQIEAKVERLEEGQVRIEAKVDDLLLVVNGGGDAELARRSPVEWARDNGPMMGTMGAIAVIVAGIIKGLEMAGVL